MRHLLPVLILLTLSLGGPHWVRAQTYSYDAVGQLTSVSYASGELVRYRYDIQGNIIRQSTYLFRGQEMLVLPESDWAYWDMGLPSSGAGVLWKDYFYNDILWPRGAAKLGYGSGEATTVSFGADPNNKEITTYFRNRFQVPNPEAVDNLWLHVLRDDGVVVYLNGTEVFRDNMPATDPTHETLAISEVVGAGENEFTTVQVLTSLLVPGQNILMAEVHLAASDSPDLAFDLALEAGISNDEPPMVALVAPEWGQYFNYTSNVVIQASAVDPDDGVAYVEFLHAGTNVLGRDFTAPYEWVVANLVPGDHSFHARAVDHGGLEGFSLPVTIHVTDPFGLFTPMLSITRVGPDLVVSWDGGLFFLQAADQPEGPWTTIFPVPRDRLFVIPEPDGNKFFRLSKFP